MNQVEIFRASAEHATMLSQLGSRLFEETFQGTCSQEDMTFQLEQVYNVSRVTAELCDPSDFFFVIQLESKVQGYSRMREGNPPADVLAGRRGIELKRLYMERHAHGNGLAIRLMQHNLQLAKVMHYQRVYLSVWEHNHRALAFYRKLGFRDTKIANPFPIGDTPQTDYWFVLDLE